MISKKLTRQLRKVLNCSDIQNALEEIKPWMDQAETPPKDLVAMSTNFEAFLESIDQSYSQYEKKLDQAHTSLEISSKEVEERNKLLRIENKKVSNLLNNMRQAVFTVNSNLNIVSPASEFAEEIFNQKVIDKNIYEILFKDLPNTSEEYSQLVSAFTCVFGEDQFQWDLVAEHFPEKVHWVVAEDNQKVLKVSVNPIMDDNGLVERVMFVVEDVTEIQKLERQVQDERNKTQVTLGLVQKLIKYDRAKIQFLLQHTRAHIDSIKAILSKTDWEKSEILGQLHTIKGNTRLYAFTDLSQIAHELEDRVQKESIDSLKDNFESELSDSLEKKFNAYTRVATEVLGFHLAGEEPAQNDSEIDESFEKFMDAYVNQVKDIAEKKQKQVEVQLNIPENFRVSNETADLLGNTLIHLLNNSVDHGIESPELRKDKGKSPSGKITITASEDDKSSCISIEDDGRGINPTLLAEKAVGMNIISLDEMRSMSKQEKIDLIFCSGLSTEDEVSEYSGRGVGMNAVKQAITDISGDISVQSEEEIGTCFKVRIPKAS